MRLFTAEGAEDPEDGPTGMTTVRPSGHPVVFGKQHGPASS